MDKVYADKLYEFLTEMLTTAQSMGNREVVQRIDAARKHYLVPLPAGKYFRPPLTSEFLGESMLALREVLEKAGSLFTAEQTGLALEYVESIRQQWFSDR